MFCRKCGIRLCDNSTFCHECGETVMTEDGIIEEQSTNGTKRNNVAVHPFREDFYQNIKGFTFVLVAAFATIYYGVNILNSIIHFNGSDIFVSLIALFYGLVAFGLTVPSLWAIYADRSPHSSFVTIKLYAFINLLKLFLIVSFGVLTVMGAIMGKEEISKGILYLADENISIYLVTLLLQCAKCPSLMLIFTSGILWITYLTAGIIYHISLILLLNTTSKRINNNTTVIKGYNAISSISFFTAAVSFINALLIFAFTDNDIYNVLAVLFKGIFHILVFLELRKYKKLFSVADESAEEDIIE